MKLSIEDYESIILIADEEEYVLKKENIGFTLTKVDESPITIEQPKHNVLSIDR